MKSDSRVEQVEAWEPAYGYCATNDRDPSDLAKALEAVRKQICAYGPKATTCDCKYGFGRSLDGERTNSEQTGCPELREVIHKLMHRWPVSVDMNGTTL